MTLERGEQLGQCLESSGHFFIWWHALAFALGGKTGAFIPTKSSFL
jgi:hypothetical protein